jgi:hypothetical protein
MDNRSKKASMAINLILIQDDLSLRQLVETQ